MSLNEEIFIRNVPGSRERLKEATVGIAGCGGLGSNAAVALTRAGLGRLILVDFDVVEASNLNRQAFFISDIGKVKVDALANHLKNINPDIHIISHQIKLTPEGVGTIFTDADILIEAFDRAESKQWLIQRWSRLHPDRPIIVGSGISGCGGTDTLKVHHAGKIYLCGDETTDMSMGLCASRVAMVANMQANIAIELITAKKEKQ